MELDRVGKLKGLDFALGLRIITLKTLFSGTTDKGRELQNALQEITGQRTVSFRPHSYQSIFFCGKQRDSSILFVCSQQVPNIFIKGTSIGGCDGTFLSLRETKRCNLFAAAC